MQQGQLAMQNTMGQAAALTGGYGSSYASTAGNQAYQQHLTGLNEVIPQLYDAAFQRYRADVSDTKDLLGIYQGLDESDYGRYRDTVSDYYTDLGLATDRYNNERQWDYGQYRDSVSDWESDRTYGYTKDQDALQQANWEKQFAYQQERDKVADEQWAKEYALQQAAAARAAASRSYSGGGGSSGSKSSNYNGYADSAGNPSSATMRQITQANSQHNDRVVIRAVKAAYDNGEITKDKADHLVSVYCHGSNESVKELLKQEGLKV